MHASTKWLKTNWSLVLVLGCFFLTTALLLAASLRANDGHLIYQLDDTYIHMAVAKNFVRHGVWGLTEYGFTSSTSSLAWPALLAAVYAVTGVNVAAPLILNIIFAAGLIVWLHRTLRCRNGEHGYLLVSVLAITYFSLVPMLVFFGMEHVLHVFVMLAFLSLGARSIGHSSTPTPCAGQCPGDAGLLALAALAPAVRYESLFLVAMFAILFILRGRRWFALALVVAAFLPISLYGLYSVAQGWFFLPNSLVIKRLRPDLHTLAGLRDFATLPWRQLREYPLMLLLFLLNLSTTAVCCVKVRHRLDEAAAANLATLGVFIQHLFLIKLHDPRYEAYLWAMSLFGVALAWHRQVAFAASRQLVTASIYRFTPAALGVIAVATPFTIRAFAYHQSVPYATHDIYQQQYHMADFLKRYHNRDGVALNDIGAACYFTDIRLLDVWGLANMPVARKKPWGVTNRMIHELAVREGIRLAMVYDRWFFHYYGVPPEWILVGRWEVPLPLVLGDSVVSIYVIDPALREPLLRELREYAPRLPRSVVQMGPYTELKK